MGFLLARRGDEVGRRHEGRRGAGATHVLARHRRARGGAAGARVGGYRLAQQPGRVPSLVDAWGGWTHEVRTRAEGAHDGAARRSAPTHEAPSREAGVLPRGREAVHALAAARATLERVQAGGAAGDQVARSPAHLRVSARLRGRPASTGAGLAGPQHDHDDHAVLAPRPGAGCGIDPSTRESIRRGKYVAKAVGGSKLPFRRGKPMAKTPGGKINRSQYT